MVKLIIKNEINDDIKNLSEKDKTIYGLICELNPYDTEKWKDGRVYEFETLKELQLFVDSCDIDFTEESEDSFDCCDWYDLIKYLSINTELGDNVMLFTLSITREFRD